MKNWKQKRSAHLTIRKPYQRLICLVVGFLQPKGSAPLRSRAYVNRISGN